MEIATTGVRGLLRLTKDYQRSYLLAILALLLLHLLDLLPPLALGLLVDSVARPERVSWSPAALALAYVGLFILQAAMRYPIRMGFVGSASRAAGMLRARYASHLLELSEEALGGRSTGDLIGRATGDCDTVEHTLSTGLLFIADCSLALLTLPMAMAILSPELFYWSMAPASLIPVLSFAQVRRITRASEETQGALGKVVDSAHENLSSVRTIRAFGLEGRQAAQFSSAVDDLLRKDLNRAREETLFSGAVQGLIALGTFLVLLVGGREVLSFRLTPGAFVTFLQYMGMMAWPLSGLAWAYVLFKKGEVSLRRVNDVAGLARSDKARGDGGAPGDGEITIRGLSFTPPASDRPLFSDLSLSIGSGERLALMGPTGGGKSSLLHLISRLLEPPKGTIYVGGRDVTEIPPDVLRRHLAVVPEDAFLFSGTVGENIELGTEDRPATRVAVGAAAAIARVIGPEFAQGLDTPVGSRGRSLSGGQRQRVAIGRAGIRRAPILLLDDASSALDQGTEAEVLDGLFRAHSGQTILYITHRVLAARRADRVLVLEGGRLVEEGPPARLLGSNGPFSRIARRQELTDDLDQT